MQTYSTFHITLAVLAALLIAGPAIIFSFWVVLTISDKIEKLSRTFGGLLGWMFYVPMGLIIIIGGSMTGVFIFSSVINYLGTTS